MKKEQSKKRKLKKITIFRQKINRKKSIILAILSKDTYECLYPDPDMCPAYNPETGLCIDCKNKCSYRKKLTNSESKNSKEINHEI